jgi:PPM family protein phosphatase
MLGKMDCAGLTDVGRVRPVNEDQYLIASLSRSMQVHSTSLNLDDQTRLFGPSQGRLLLVADGMGGHAAGRRASTLALDALASYVLNTMHWFFRLREDREDVFVDDLKSALEHCQAEILAEARRVPGERGMGTTLTMAYLAWPRLFVVHAGDSRCYLMRQGRLRRITRDHTVAQRLADAGELDDPEHSRWSHVLWNVVGGTEHEIRPEVHRADLALGDTLLLCTDGLTQHVSDADIARLLGPSGPSAEACGRLVEAANAAGGSDNVTVVVARFRETGPDEEAATAAAAANPGKAERAGREAAATVPA